MRPVVHVVNGRQLEQILVSEMNNVMDMVTHMIIWITHRILLETGLQHDRLVDSATGIFQQHVNSINFTRIVDQLQQVKGLRQNWVFLPSTGLVLSIPLTPSMPAFNPLVTATSTSAIRPVPSEFAQSEEWHSHKDLLWLLRFQVLQLLIILAM